MIKTLPWVEHPWNFTLPAGMFPNIVERLRGMPVRIEEKLASWPEELLTRRPGEGWSVQEHIGHLIEVEALALGRLDDFEAGLPVLRAADMTNRRTYERQFNERPLDEILAELRRARMHFVARLEPYDEAMILRTALHPRLKVPMRLLDAAYFFAEHDDHHLVRMRETMDALTAAR